MSSDMSAADASARKSIELTVGRSVVSLGGPLVIDVKYINTSKQPVTFRDPPRVW
jgi:hypothetical protein